MKPLVLALLGSALLSSGCVPSRLVIPDQSVPHQLAAETTAEVWVQAPDGKWTKQRVRLLEGWWVASPQVVDGGPGT